MAGSKLQPFVDLGHSLFRTHILYQTGCPVIDHLVGAMLADIDCDRRQRAINSSRFRKLVSMLQVLEVPDGSRTKIYKAIFQPAYLAHSKVYYKETTKERIQTMDSIEYLRYVSIGVRLCCRVLDRRW